MFTQGRIPDNVDIDSEEHLMSCSPPSLASVPNIVCHFHNNGDLGLTPRNDETITPTSSGDNLTGSQVIPHQQTTSLDNSTGSQVLPYQQTTSLDNLTGSQVLSHQQATSLENSPGSQALQAWVDTTLTGDLEKLNLDSLSPQTSINSENQSENEPISSDFVALSAAELECSSALNRISAETMDASLIQRLDNSLDSSLSFQQPQYTPDASLNMQPPHYRSHDSNDTFSTSQDDTLGTIHDLSDTLGTHQECPNDGIQSSDLAVVQNDVSDSLRIQINIPNLDGDEELETYEIHDGTISRSNDVDQVMCPSPCMDIDGGVYETIIEQPPIQIQSDLTEEESLTSPVLPPILPPRVYKAPPLPPRSRDSAPPRPPRTPEKNEKPVFTPLVSVPTSDEGACAMIPDINLLEPPPPPLPPRRYSPVSSTHGSTESTISIPLDKEDNSDRNSFDSMETFQGSQEDLLDSTGSAEVSPSNQGACIAMPRTVIKHASPAEGLLVLEEEGGKKRHRRKRNSGDSVNSNISDNSLGSLGQPIVKTGSGHGATKINSTRGGQGTVFAQLSMLPSIESVASKDLQRESPSNSRSLECSPRASPLSMQTSFSDNVTDRSKYNRRSLAHPSDKTFRGSELIHVNTPRGPGDRHSIATPTSSVQPSIGAARGRILSDEEKRQNRDQIVEQLQKWTKKLKDKGKGDSEEVTPSSEGQKAGVDNLSFQSDSAASIMQPPPPLSKKTHTNRTHPPIGSKDSNNPNRTPGASKESSSNRTHPPGASKENSSNRTHPPVASKESNSNRTNPPVDSKENNSSGVNNRVKTSSPSNSISPPASTKTTVSNRNSGSASSTNAVVWQLRQPHDYTSSTNQSTGEYLFNY